MGALRRIALLASLGVVLGCSSLSTLVLRNGSPEIIRYRAIAEPHHSDLDKGATGELERGASTEVMRHMGLDTLVIEITAGPRAQRFTFAQGQLPSEIAHPGSGGAVVDAVFTGNSIRFDVRTRSRLNDSVRLAMGLSCASVFALILLVRVLRKRPTRLAHIDKLDRER